MLEQHPALAVLRLGDAEQVGERRREVDRARRHLALAMPLPPARNVARMLMLAARSCTSGT